MKTLKKARTFNAPWSRELLFMSLFGFVICVGVSSIGWQLPATYVFPRWSAIIIPMAALIAAAIPMVRGYSLANNSLLVHRLCWSTQFDLSTLVSATYQPDIMANSIRTAGMGGLFAFWGNYQNQALGDYKIYGTDPRRSVVLNFTDKVVLITPDNPEQFINELMRGIKT